MVIVIERNQDFSHPERRVYTAEEYDNRARTGARISLAVHDMGLSPTIGRSNRDANGTNIEC